MRCPRQENVGAYMKIVFGSVVYRKAWRYKAEFINSLNGQQGCEFDILIINDDVEEAELKEFLKLSKRHVNVISKPMQMSIAQLRVFLLTMAKKMNYDLLVLGDFDDTFHHNRIEAIAASYTESFGFYYNPLYSIKEHSIFKKLPEALHNYKDILECNFLGLSNTAINLRAVSMKFIESLCEGKTDVFDWYLYTRLMLNGLSGLLVEKAVTYYRIYEHNLAGVADANDENLKKEVAVKILHYKLLKNYSQALYRKYKLYKNISKEVYLQNLNNNSQGYWWNQIRIKE